MSCSGRNPKKSKKRVKYYHPAASKRLFFCHGGARQAHPNFLHFANAVPSPTSAGRGSTAIRERHFCVGSARALACSGWRTANRTKEDAIGEGADGHTRGARAPRK